jgi:MPBQ/MSBQ methyltransferase
MTAASPVARHYGSHDVSARILEALISSGRDPDQLTREDLASFDEFHGGGLASTRDLARYAGVNAGQAVLDLGCGIGGPARTLAAELGCNVQGLDLTPGFIAAAEMLTERVGLSDRCCFRTGDATALPFSEASFDVVWSQNVLMNIADKAACFREVARILRPGGIFAFETVLAAGELPVIYPTFWAEQPALSHLITRGELEALLEASGLSPRALDDTTQAVMNNGRQRQLALDSVDPTALSIAVLVPHDAALKTANGRLNNEQGRTHSVKAVYCRPHSRGSRNS